MTAHRVLSGSVSIDGRYALDARAGQLVSNNGGSVLAFLGAGALGAAGGNLISDKGTNVVSNNGANVISNNGGGMLGSAKFYRVSDLAAPTTKPQLPMGEIVPAAGMLLQALDPITGAKLPLGEGPDGKPAYEILTNASGGYTVYLPTGASPVSLVAQAPESPDQRLMYPLTVSSGATSATIDEDTAQVSRAFLRVGARLWFNTLSVGVPFLKGTPGAKEPPEIGARRAAFEAFLAASGVRAMDAAEQMALARRVHAITMKHSDPSVLRVDKTRAIGPYDGPDETVFDAFLGALKGYREAINRQAQKVEGEGGDALAYLNARPYVEAANVGRAEPYVFKKPADMVEFVVEHYMTNTSVSFLETALALPAIVDDLQLPPDGLKRFTVAFNTAFSDWDRVMFREPTGCEAESRAEIERTLAARGR